MAPAIEVPPRATTTRGTDEFPLFLRRLIERYLGQWHGAGESLPELSTSFDPAQQNANRARIDHLMTFLSREFEHYPDSPERIRIWERRILHAMKIGCRDILCLPAACAETIFSRPFVGATRSFIRQAKAFDPSIEAA